MAEIKAPIIERLKVYNAFIEDLRKLREDANNSLETKASIEVTIRSIISEAQKAINMEFKGKEF